MTWPLRWPVPALLAWTGAWLIVALLRGAQVAPEAGLVVAMTVPAALAWRTPGTWRRVIALAGFPASWMLVHGAAAPAWLWAVALAALLVAYPMRAWSDAPFFPTRRDALLGLRDDLVLPMSPRVLDAGCGAGDGLIAWRNAWPSARCEGVEWSRLLAWIAALRCGGARIRRGDLWADDWSGFDVVYVFQRPESMPRVWAKARAQMKPGAWLVSLEFDIAGVAPTLSIQPDGGRAVHAWCVGRADAGHVGRADAGLIGGADARCLRRADARCIVHADSAQPPAASADNSGKPRARALTRRGRR